MKIVSRVLPTGLRVFLIPMRGVKSLTGLFVVKAGWRYETEKEIQGLSHFLEHMAFKGTRKRPTAQDIATEIEGKGADTNASTGEESIFYYIKSASRFKEMVYDVLSDIVLSPLLDQAEIDMEAGTIIEEIRFYESTPMNHVVQLWPKLLYGDQPAGANGLGTEETVRSFKRNQFVDYMQQLYTASNSAVILAGRLEDEDKEMMAMEQYFQNLSLQPPERTMPSVVELQAEPKLLLLSKDIEQTWVLLGVRAYSIQNKERYALRLLSIILGGGMSSRMFIEIRERRGLAYAVRSDCDFQSDVGSFYTYAGLNSQKIREAIRVILDEYQKIASEKVPEKELRKAKDFIKGRTELALEDLSAVAHRIANDFVLRGEVFDPQKELKKYEAVSAEDIQRVAKDIFKNEKLNLAMIGPHAENEEQIRELLKFQ